MFPAILATATLVPTVEGTSNAGGGLPGVGAVPAGRIFLIFGSPAVGKTSTAERLASRFDRAVVVPVDDLRSMVVAGYVWPDAEWAPEVDLQVTLAGRTAIWLADRWSAA